MPVDIACSGGTSPNVTSPRALLPPMILGRALPLRASSSDDHQPVLIQPQPTMPLSPPSLSFTNSAEGDAATQSEVDPQILEALRSAKDRIYVLKLGEQMESLITERRYVRYCLSVLEWYQPPSP